MPASRPSLDLLSVFATVAETGGFTAAARVLGTTKAHVSQQVRKLEGDLGGALFTRTTRRVVLTGPGETFLRECAPLLRDLRGAVERFGQASAHPTGTLRITCPADFAEEVLAPVIAELRRQQPQLAIDIVASAQIVDLVAARIDLAIRCGRLEDSSLRSTRVGSFDEILVAAPSYLAFAGTPTRLEQLAAHRLVALSVLPAPCRFRLLDRGGRATQVRFESTIRASSPEVVRGLARAGAGLAILPDYSIATDLARGTLVRVLGGYRLRESGVHAVYADARPLPARVRVFIDLLRARIA